MRTTCINTIHVERSQPYDENYHGLVDQRGDIQVALGEVIGDALVFNLGVKFHYTARETGDAFGHIEVRATSRITGIEDVVDPQSFDMNDAPENIKRLVEGAIGEDVLLPMATIARLAKMPSVLPIPLIFPRQGGAEEE